MQKYKINDPENEYNGQIGTLLDETKLGTPQFSMFHLQMDDGEKPSFLAHQIEKLPERKILFLDIDGVCNSQEFMTSNRNPKIGGMLGIDPFPAVLVKMIVQDTGCEVVLSSTWRLNEWSRESVRNEVVDFIDVTPHMGAVDRGYEIEAWLAENPDVTKYAILDDSMDMLVYQAPNFFRTQWLEGLTREIAQAVTEHLNG